MAGPDDLDARLTALETQVAELTAKIRDNERDAAAARCWPAVPTAT